VEKRAKGTAENRIANSHRLHGPAAQDLKVRAVAEIARIPGTVAGEERNSCEFRYQAAVRSASSKRGLTMTKASDHACNWIQDLRDIALKYPEAQEGIACAGTALESHTVKVRNKAFLFLGKSDVMIKLGESVTEATKLASKTPDQYKVGAHGWVKVMFSDGNPPPPGLLERWIDESYRMLAPKQLLPSLPETGRASRSAKKLVRKKVAKNHRGEKSTSSH
jgi:hypothetical protein